MCGQLRDANNGLSKQCREHDKEESRLKQMNTNLEDQKDIDLPCYTSEVIRAGNISSRAAASLANALVIDLDKANKLKYCSLKDIFTDKSRIDRQKECVKNEIVRSRM